jgi:hypothetical protein
VCGVLSTKEGVMPQDIQDFIDQDDVFDIEDIIDLEEELNRRSSGYAPAVEQMTAGWDEIPF